MENEGLNNEKPLKNLEITMRKEKSLSCFTLTLTFTSAIGGFLFGYNTGVVSGALVMLNDHMPMTDLQKQVFVSLTMLAALVFSLISGFLNDFFGRKKTMMLAAMVFVIGGIVLAAAQNIWTLFIGRIIIGIALGISSMSTSMYIAECSPRSHRGLLVTVNTVFVTGAQFVSCIVCGLVNFYPVYGWRLALGLGTIPAGIQLIMFTCLPESPRWLVGRGKESAARKILKKIEEDDDVVDEEITAINHCLHQNEESRGFSTLSQVLRTKHVMKALFVGVVLQAVQQFGGINAVMYYSATIIQMSGVESLSNAIWLSALVAFINFLATFISFPMVDQVGRRTLTLLSLFGAFLGLLVLGVGFKLASIKSPPVSLSLINASSCLAYSTCETCVEDPTCNFCYQPADSSFSNTFCYSTNIYNNHKNVYGFTNSNQTNENAYANNSYNENSQCSFIFKQTFLTSKEKNIVDNSGLNKMLIHKPWRESFKYCNTPFYWLSTFGMIVFLIFFAPGMGPMPWTINSEIYPNWARSTCVSIATCVNWLCNMIVSFTFLSLISSVGGYGAFFLFSGMVFLSFILLILILPETKNKSLEEIEDLFRGRLLVKGKEHQSLM